MLKLLQYVDGLPLEKPEGVSSRVLICYWQAQVIVTEFANRLFSIISSSLLICVASR